MENPSKLESAIREFDLNYNGKKSSNISVLENITQEQLNFHIKKLDLVLDADEKPLLMLNLKKGIRLYGFSGFLITDKKIHFSLLKRSYFATYFPRKDKDLLPIRISDINSFQIGKLDSCIGTTYVGHDLVINNKPLGLVRLGFGLLYDEEALNYINGLSKDLFVKGFLKNEPKLI